MPCAHPPSVMVFAKGALGRWCGLGKVLCQLDRGLAQSPRHGPEQRLCEPRESRGTSAGQSEGPQQSPTCRLPDLGHPVARTLESHCLLCRLPGLWGFVMAIRVYQDSCSRVHTEGHTLRSCNCFCQRSFRCEEMSPTTGPEGPKGAFSGDILDGEGIAPASR